ncbi:alpha/beta hydrolase [Amycolatopsis sp. WAC 01375]|uniref:poly(ethylene terephthalate) hydrolase family protein n=1 Tax=Amycolatopsis sp. WAC 01375 TaxID=2203194 RepID=UPI000F7B98F9|nr:dienelactone hydrolase family protein [Amycolatopsis sp. WAC 01375]RSM70453.1 alpha/beta hydrolase [Amycolatopsis sp. WAC 01375]
MKRGPQWTAAVVGAVTALLVSVPAAAGESPYARGPEPTTATIEGDRGSFEIATEKVPAGQGFGAGTIHYPTDTRQGTFGAIAIAPGFLESEAAIAWYGPRLASQGFVVITFSTKSTWDTPDNRSEQLLAALRYVTETSQAKSRVDRDRLAVMGHSMGGGGALIASQKAPALKAAIPLTGWNPNTTFSDLKVPTFVVSAQNDFIAPDGTYSRPFYQSLPESLDKAYVLLAGAGHLVPTKPNVTIAKYSISWLKRFVDEDTRYDRFLCPLPANDPKIAVYRGTCPIG